MPNDNKSTERTVKIIILSASVLVIVLAGCCLAWFAFSKDADLSGFFMTSGGSYFELRTYGDDVYKDELTELGYTEFGSSIVSALNKSGNETSAAKQTVRWLMSEDDKGISPGSSGELTFYVAPKKDGKLNMKFSLDMTGYIAEASDTEAEDGSAETVLTAVDDDTSKLLNGHIMFFLNKDGDSYSGRITDGTFEKSFPDAKAGEEYEVTVYWVWAYTFGQLVLTDGDDNLMNRSVIFADNDEKSDFIKELKKDLGCYLKSSTGSDTLKTEIDDVCNEKYSRKNYLDLCEAYNNADQSIGENVSYVLVTLDANRK